MLAVAVVIFATWRALKGRNLNGTIQTDCHNVGIDINVTGEYLPYRHRLCEPIVAP